MSSFRDYVSFTEGIYFDAKDHKHNGAWILPISVIKSQPHFTRTE